MAIIGIDLGTTNSLGAVYIHGEVKLIPNSQGEVMTPSVVSLLDSGEIVVGKIAKEIGVKKPERTVGAFKRFMGANKVYKLGENKFTPVELSALVIKSIVRDAEEYLGENVNEAIISVPAYFNHEQRKATKEAAMMAGLKVERLINEPTAAAVAYHIHESKDEKVVAIVDIGGGTYDVSILDVFESVLEVRSIAGDNYFGGEDFDQAIMEHICMKIDLDINDLIPQHKSKLKYIAEDCKRQITSKKRAEKSFELNGTEYNIEISMEQFERVVMDLLNKIRLPLKKAIKESDFSYDEIDEVILVGGSTRMPSIKSTVAKLFGFFPLCDINPDHVVAVGAGICAAMKDKNEELKDTVLTDVCPFTLGIDTGTFLGNGEYVGDIYSPMIERNTMIPCSIIRSFTTLKDNQKKIQVPVYQGEARKSSDNLYLGKLEIKVPPKKKGEAEIGVRFTYDINGLLEVEVNSYDTGIKKKAVLINNNNMTEEDIEKRMRELSNIKIHPKEEEENLLLISRGERLYEITLGDVRDNISYNLMIFERVLEKQNKIEIKKAAKMLKEFLDFVEREY